MGVTNLFNLKGKTALITGGSQGIGKSISLALAEHGANVFIIFRSGKDFANQTKEEILKLGVQCWTMQNDISQNDSAQQILDFTRSKNIEIDILVLNASVQYRNEWNKVTNEEFHSQVNTNFRASLFLIQKLYPTMQGKHWGRIVTVGSVQQVRPHQQMIVYAATKMAQLSMVKSLAPQFAPYGVTINNLAPGAIETRRNEEVLSDIKYRKITEKKIPSGYVGEPNDCAATALLLCSDAGRYITGQDIYVDGGMGLNS